MINLISKVSHPLTLKSKCANTWTFHCTSISKSISCKWLVWAKRAKSLNRVKMKMPHLLLAVLAPSKVAENKVSSVKLAPPKNSTLWPLLKFTKQTKTSLSLLRSSQFREICFWIRRMWLLQSWRNSIKLKTNRISFLNKDNNNMIYTTKIKEEVKTDCMDLVTKQILSTTISLKRNCSTRTRQVSMMLMLKILRRSSSRETMMVMMLLVSNSHSLHLNKTNKEN